MINSASFRKMFVPVLLVLQFINAHAGIFLPLDFNQVCQLARKENKLLMLKFNTSWSQPCKYLDNTVFADKELYDYMSRRVIAYQIDIEQPAGADLKLRYNVKKVPTIIFIHPNGNEVSRRENSMTVKDFRSWIENLVQVHRIPASAPCAFVTPPGSEVSGKPAPARKDSGEVVINGQRFDTRMENPNAVAHQEKNAILFGQFYVQTGAYRQMENALQQAEELDVRFSQNASVLEESDRDGQPVFKLNMGPFDSEEEADLFALVLRDRNIEAIVRKSEF